MDARNILVVGLISYPAHAKLSQTAKRDQCRIDVLRDNFGTVFSLAKHAQNADPTVHVTCSFNYAGARDLVGLMDSAQHAHKQLHYVCVEHVPRTRSRNGSTSNDRGSPMDNSPRGYIVATC